MNQAFCDGVVEVLTTSLTQLERFQGSLLVVPASEVRRQSIATVRQAQRSFGVNRAVTGSVQRSGASVRVTVNLVDAHSVRQVGARVIELSTDDLAGMEDRLVSVVTELLDLELQPQARDALTAGRTAISDAFDWYIQGRGYLQRYDKPGNVENAMSAFRQALQLDPRYALANAGLGEAYLRNFLNNNKEPQWLELAQNAVAQSISQNGQLAPAHVDLGMIYSETGQYDNAVAEFRRALDLDPVSVDAYRELARAYERKNRLKDAEATYQKAIRLRPGAWLTNANLGAFYYNHGRYAEAEPLFRRVIELTPDNFNGYVVLGGLYILLGREADAERLLRKSISVQPSDRGYSNLATLYYQKGRYADAAAIYEKAVALASNNYMLFGNMADSYRRVPGLASKAPDTYRTAARLAEQRLAINPSDPAVLKSAATYHARIGEKDQAFREISLARKLAPADTTVGFQAVLVYELVGRRTDALVALDNILKAGYPLNQVEREADLSELRATSEYKALASRDGGSRRKTN
jgi:serine/threonine-protein kinase